MNPISYRSSIDRPSITDEPFKNALRGEPPRFMTWCSPRSAGRKPKACFLMPIGPSKHLETRMTALTVDEAIDLIRDHVRLLPAERVPLFRAGGKILREAVVALEDCPAFDRSAVDGYAVLNEEKGALLRIVDEIRPGEMKSRPISPGEAVRIFTGAALPGPGLRVVMQEDTRREGTQLHVLRWDKALNVRLQGEDAQKGRTLLEDGQILESGQLALLASSGQAEPLVSRDPKILHLVIGDELVDPSSVPAPGQIRDCNSVLVDSFIRQNGGTIWGLKLPEDYRQASRMINPNEMAGVDLLLISGGASVGEHDFTEQLLVDLGFDIHFRRLKARPGKPLIFGTREGMPAFGLPGNPLAHYVCLQVYAAQALYRMRGYCQDRDFKMIGLSEPLSLNPQSAEILWPARLEWSQEGPCLKPLSWRSSGDITSLALANAVFRVPSECAHLPAGANVAFLSTSSSSML